MITSSTFNKIIAILILLMVSSHLSRGQGVPCFFDSIPKTSVKVCGSIDLNADGITNEFLNAFFNSEFLDNGLKTRSLERLDDNNHLGFTDNISLQCIYKPDQLFKQNDLAIMLEFHYDMLTELRFSRDVFELSFFGNTNWVGREAQFNDLLLREMQYQQVKFGLLKQKRNHIFGFSVNAYKGQDVFQYSLEKGSLFTHPNLEHIDINISSNLLRSDTAGNALMNFNGWGLGLDLFYSYSDRQGNQIFANLRDAGAIQWNKESFCGSKDSLYHFQGIEVDNIFTVTEDVFDQYSGDSLEQEFLLYSGKKACWNPVPMRLQFGIKRKISEVMSIQSAVNLWFFTVRRPEIFLGLHLKAFEGLSFTPFVTAGGYGNFDVGIEACYYHPKGLFIKGGSRYLDGFLFPKKAVGMGGFICLGYNLNMYERSQSMY